MTILIVTLAVLLYVVFFVWQLIEAPDREDSYAEYVRLKEEAAKKEQNEKTDNEKV